MLYICNMEQIIFIKDLTNQHIGNAISRLCVMADIDPPDEPRGIVDMLRNKYWKYDATIFQNAFDAWMVGTYPEIMRVKKINIIFLTTILNQYVQNNWHRIKKYNAPALEMPKPSPEELEAIAKRSLEMTTNEWLAVYRDKRTERLSIKLMEINWKRIYSRGEHDGNFSNEDIRRIMEFLNEYDSKYTAHIAKQLGNKNKEKRFMDVMNGVVAMNRNIDGLIDASKFALYINQKFGIQ